MIGPIDHTSESVANRIVAVQRAAYAVEAELIGFDGIPPLHESVADIQALKELQWAAAFDGDHNETIVGIIAWSDDDGGIEIDRLAIDPAWSRRGHGRSLVQSVPSAPVMRVSTGLLNHPAVALYESEGYRRVGTTEIAPGILTCQFERTL